MVGRGDPTAPQEEFVPQFDLDGNQTLIKTSTGIWSVTYNGENRPILWTCIQSDNQAITNNQTILMTYDRMGRRVTKNAQRFVYDGYLQIANFEHQTSNIKLQTFIWDPTAPVATRPLAWNFSTFQPFNLSTFYYTHDGIKNVSELVLFQQANGIAAHYEYAPFGAVTASTCNTSVTSIDARTLNPFRFSSEYADDTLGLVYYNYRHYDSAFGRWQSRDVIEEFGELNLLGFIGNNVSGFDFLGLDRMITQGLASPPQGIKLALLAEILYINEKLGKCYAVYIRDLEYSSLNEINSLASQEHTTVMIMAHGGFSVPHTLLDSGDARIGKDGFYYSKTGIEPILYYALNNGKTRIPVSELKVPANNLFGCYISPAVRRHWEPDTKEFSWKVDAFGSNGMEGNFLKRLRELTPDKKCCKHKQTIYLFEGELSNVILTDEELRQSSTRRLQWEWENYIEAIKSEFCKIEDARRKERNVICDANKHESILMTR